MLRDPIDRAPLTGTGPDRPADSWLTARPRTALLVATGAFVALVIGAAAGTNLRIAVALLLAFGLVVVVLVRPFVGGLVLVGLVPIISGLAPGVPIRSIRASEALIGLIGITLIVTARRRDAVPWRPLDWLVLAYGLAWCAFGVADAQVLHEHLTLSSWGTVLGQLQFFLIYRGVRLAVRSRVERRIAVVVALVASVPVAVLAILQQIKAPGVSAFLFAITGSNEATTAAAGTVAPLSIQSLHRTTGPFDNWTSLAGYLFPVILVLCSLALAHQLGRYRRWALVVAALATAGLLLSEEQSAIIGLVIGAIALGVKYGQTRRMLRYLLVGLAFSAVIAGPILGQRVDQELNKSAGSSRSAWVPQTLAYRGQVWTQQYIPAIEQRPLTGYGVETPSTIQWPYTESEYVTILMEGGLPLLALFAALAWAMVRRGQEAARSPDPFERAFGRGLTVGIVLLIFMDVIWPYMSNGGLPQVLWAMLAIAGPGGTAAAVRSTTPTAENRASTAAVGGP